MSTDTQKEHALIQEIIEKFGFQMFEYQPCRRIWRVRTNAGYKYLKKSKLNSSDLWFIFEALEFLSKNSFQNVPHLAWSEDREPFVKASAGLFILTDWYFGTELDFRLLMDLKQSTRFLAEFHQKSAGFTPKKVNPDRICWHKWPPKLQERIQQLREFRLRADQEKSTSPFSRLYLQHFEPYYQQAIASYQALLASPYPEVAREAIQTRSFCHHDYSSRNLLRTYDNQLYLVDFDYCLFDIRIHDIINLLVRNLKHNDWNLDCCNLILQEYQKVSKLSPAEIEVMYILLSWPQDFWQVGLQYYVEQLLWPPERFIKKLQHKTDCRLSRDRFLREFATQYKLKTI